MGWPKIRIDFYGNGKDRHRSNDLHQKLVLIRSFEFTISVCQLNITYYITIYMALKAKRSTMNINMCIVHMIFTLNYDVALKDFI